MADLKRTLVTLGIIALAIGLTTMLETGIFSKDVITYTTPWQNSDKWEISGNFTAGNMLNFTIVPGADWGLMAEPKRPGGQFPFDSLPVDVSLIDPNGGTTNFTYVFAQANQEGLEPQLMGFGATPTSNDGGMTLRKEDILAESNQTIFYNGIKGIVKYSGIYRAVVVSSGLPTTPKYLRLYRLDMSVERPYLFLTPIGGVIVGSGVALSAWGAKKPKHNIKRKN